MSTVMIWKNLFSHEGKAFKIKFRFGVYEIQDPPVCGSNGYSICKTLPACCQPITGTVPVYIYFMDI